MKPYCCELKHDQEQSKQWEYYAENMISQNDISHSKRNISAYDVQYTEAGVSNWKNIQFRGANPSAVLQNLKRWANCSIYEDRPTKHFCSNTDYILRITTLLENNAVTQSGMFKFKTPEGNRLSIINLRRACSGAESNSEGGCYLLSWGKLG